MKKYKCPFKQYQLVQFKLPEIYRPIDYQSFPFAQNEIVVFLGEIVQMPGHCIVACKNGKVYWGYHTDNFVEPDKDRI